MTAMRVEARAVALHIASGAHPNKTPFSGTLVILDQIADFAPAGAHGRKIVLTSQAAGRALSTLLGMGINYASSLDRHSPKHKVGFISSAEILGNAVLISGFLYGADLPQEVRAIKEAKDDLGFSFEAERLTFLDPCSPILTITALTFTGAAILLKSKAAYHLTSLAASKARAPTPTSLAASAGAATTLPNKEIRHMDYVTQTELPARLPLKPFPYHFANGPALIRTLDAIGFAMPATISALAAANQRLGSGGHRIGVQELDQVLSTYDIPVHKRMQLKAEMSRQGLL